MGTVQIVISRGRSKVTTSTDRGGRFKTVLNENIAYGIEQYVSEGKTLTLSLTERGDADVYFQAILRLQKLFVTQETFFESEVEVHIKQARPLKK